ncbi:hypothetical protein F8B43_2406 [Methylorubrum populi]|uniref:Uncharacterized protein n=1 Tax=Methylorubrum populi TaxID=223967 RepID=A0A833J496_9HYPH|nr:hypothetical protein F8B43_2406 [Methylorubrum populi]
MLFWSEKSAFWLNRFANSLLLSEDIVIISVGKAGLFHS